MPITRTRLKPNSTEVQEVTHLHEGRVVEVRKYLARRNVSDTLDCSDYQDVVVTEALVYFGRKVSDEPHLETPRRVLRKSNLNVVERWLNHHELKPGEEIPPLERLGWIDCTNTFVWRGAASLKPTVDAFPLGVGLTDPDFLEDYAVWKAHTEEVARKTAEDKRVREEAQHKAQEEIERDRPVKGKKMVVFKGRKVKVGTIGTVAYVHESGRVLLKDDDKWQDRGAQGTWVSGSNLKART